MLVAKLFIYTGFVIGCLRSVLFVLGAEGFEETVVSSLFALVLVVTGATLAVVNMRPGPDQTTAPAAGSARARETGGGAEDGAE